MALTEQTIVTQQTVLPDGQVGIQTSRVIYDDGVEIARTFHRHVVHPGADLTNEEVDVKRLCEFVQTLEVIAKYNADRLGRD